MNSVTAIQSRTDLQQDLDRLVSMINGNDIEGARDYVKGLVRDWPDSPRVRHWAEVLEPPRVLPKEPASVKAFSSEEIAWLKAHASEYPGCWIALDESRLIAADPELSVVRKAAKEDGADDPLFHFAPDPAKCS